MAASHGVGDTQAQSDESESRSLRDAKRKHVLGALGQTKYRLQEAAELLGIEPEDLKKLMAELGIEQP